MRCGSTSELHGVRPLAPDGDRSVEHRRADGDRAAQCGGGFLALGFLCNVLIRPVHAKRMMSADEMGKLQPTAGKGGGGQGSHGIGGGGFGEMVLLAWLAVAIPLAWNIWKTLGSAVRIFG